MKTRRFDDIFLTTHNLWEEENRQSFREQIMQAIYKKENANLLAQFAEDAINAINKNNLKRGVTD